MKIDEKNYIDFKVYEVTPIKKKYGFRIILIYDDQTIRVLQKSGFKTKKEANAMRNTVITELHNGTFVVNNNINVKTYFTYWLEEIMRPKITNDSYDSYKNIVYNHIIKSLGSVKLITLTSAHIQKFYNEKANFSNSIVKLCKTVMNSALKYAKGKKLVSINAADGVDLPKRVRSGKYRTLEIDVKKTLNVEQIKLLLEKAKDTPIYLQVMFAVLMGLRKQEINGLKYSDIDYIHRTIKVQRQLGKKPNIDNSELKVGEYTKQEIKVKTMSSMRELEIPDILFEAILEERKKYEKNKIRRQNDKTTPFKDYNYIICSSYGNPRSKSFHFKYWKQLLKDCNLPDIRFHDLRATYSTLLLKNNFSAKAVSTLLGHAKEIITFDVYGDNGEIIADCVDELNSFIYDVRPDREVVIRDESDFCIDEKLIQELITF